MEDLKLAGCSVKELTGMPKVLVPDLPLAGCVNFSKAFYVLVSLFIHLQEELKWLILRKWASVIHWILGWIGHASRSVNRDENILRRARRLSKWKQWWGIRQQGDEEIEIHGSSEDQGPSQLHCHAEM